MNYYFKNFILTLCLLLLITSLFANNYYQPDFYLSGHVPFNNNTPRFLHARSSFSLNEENYFTLDALVPTIVYQLDLETEMIRVLIRYGNHQVSNPIYISFEAFLDNMFYVAFDREFGKVKIQQLTTSNRIDQQGLIPEIIIRLPPGAMPRTVRRIMGNEAGRLNLSGSQRITVSAGRTHRKTNQVTEWGGNTDFNINIKQDLSLFLRGTIGEKIAVSVRYNSGQESNIFDPNNVSVKYTGDEDEIIQSIDAGNISLSLPGSRHISSVGSSQGLFGVRSVFKLGDLTITAYMAKEESQKNTRTYRGTSQPDSSIVKSRDFAKRRMYYVVDPAELFETYVATDTFNGAPVPGSWVGNAIRTDDYGGWRTRENLLPDETTLKVFIDRHQSGVTTARDGILINEDGSRFNDIDYKFVELFEGANADYLYDRDRGLLIFNTAVQTNHTIAVAYTQRITGNTIGYVDSDPESILQLKPIRVNGQQFESPTWRYESRNIYDLGMRNIRSDGFELEAFWENSDKTRNYYASDESDVVGMPIIEYLKLDTNGDQQIDGRDATIDLSRGIIELPFIYPFYGLGDKAMYETNNTVQDDQFQYNFFIRGRIGRDSINLGMMILPGSVKITLNGKEIRENIDYMVDYDGGNISFLTAEGRDPDSEIQIDYENRPLFAIDSKTLMGLRADWRPTNIFRLGGTFIYHSESMTDQRPRLGNEGRTLIMANVDGEVAVDVPIITTAIDYIPLINTDDTSRLSLSGELVMSVPRMKSSSDFGSGNEAWLDDMESIQEIYPLGIMRPSWALASEPFGTNLVRGRTNWFNATNVYYRDVYAPNTISAKDRVEKLNVLDVKIHPPPIYTPGVSTPVWGGLMKFVGHNIDFSEREYIEFLVKVDSVSVHSTQVKMYIDMGDVSEDFYVDNGGRGFLNTEDANGDGILQWTEDIGLSGIAAGQPGFDPFDRFDNAEINGEFPFINGTIGNGILDTEDLNGNGILDTLERLYRYQVTLGDTLTSYFQSEYNGWQLYRIPLKNNPLMQSLSNLQNSEANLENISFVRVWFETETLAKVRLVYLDVVGNKWKEMPIRVRDDVDLFTEVEVHDNVISSNNTFTSIETIDNHRSSRYVPPPRTTKRGTDGEVSLEQALMIHYNNLQPGQISFARQRFRENFNLMSYNKLRYWVYLEDSQDSFFRPDTLNVIMRLGVDLNQTVTRQSYYEILKPVQVTRNAGSMDIINWNEIEIDFTDITILKTLSENPDSTQVIYTKDNVTYRLFNRPTLSNIRDMALGIEVPNGEMPFTGTVYFNDVRVADPNQNVGYVASATFDAKFADFSNFRVTYEYRTADFIGTTSRSTSTASMDDRIRLNLRNDYSLHKFFPVAWGIRFPLDLTYEHSEGIPRYKSNSDILREILPEEEKEREKNIDYSRSATSSISMTRTPNNKIIEYTLRNMSLNANVREQHRLTAVSADTTFSFRSTGTYNLSIPQKYLQLKLWGNYYFQYFPKDYTNSLTYRYENPKRWGYRQYPASTEWGWQLPVTAVKDTEVLETSNVIRYDMLSDLNITYRLNTKRDLLYENMIGGLNIGTEDDRTQVFDIPYNPVFMTRISPTQVQANVTYRQQRRVVTSHSTGDEEITYDGNVQRNTKVSMTLKNSDWLSSLANKFGAAANRRYEANTRESTTNFDDYGTDPFDNRGDSFFDNDSRNDDYFNQEYNFNMDRNDRGREGDRGTEYGRPPSDRDRERDRYMEQGREPDRGREQERGREPDRTEETQPPATTETTTTSSKGPNTIVADIFGIFARLQNFSLVYDNQYQSRFEKMEETPDFLYQLGIPNILEDEDLMSRGTTNGFNASTGFPIVRNLVSDLRYHYNIARTYTNTGPQSQTITTRWPDVGVTYSGFERLIRAEKILSSSRLQTRYSYEERLTFQSADWNNPQQGVYTHTLNPLIGWTGNWANNLTSTFTTALTYSEANNYGSSQTTIRENTKISYTGSIGYSFSSEQPLKIPFTGRSINLRNQLTSNLAVSYEKNDGKTITTDSEHVDVDTSRLSITPTASYNFHRNMRGGLRGNYDINTNNIRGESTNMFSLDIWVEVTF